MSEKLKLPVLFPKKMRNTTRGSYLVTANIYHKEEHHFKGQDGSDFVLYTPKSESNNHKDKRPNIGVIVECFGETIFKPGTQILMDHFVLQGHDGTTNEIYEDYAGKKYWAVENCDVFAAIIDGELVPNIDFLICEYVEDKLIETELFLPGNLTGQRQDIARIVSSSNKYYEPGSYILVEDYSLYEIQHAGKRYAKVDISMDDAVAVVDSPKWRKNKVLDMNLSDVEPQ